MHITNYIRTGKENAITREQLCSLTGLPDRAVRKLIELARMEGAIIVNQGDGKGYYISEDEQDIRRQICTNHSRAMAILRQQSILRHKLREIEGAAQMTIEEA